jgi:predicted AlkP superfamily phosphohydrolase/phosphomutase
MRRLLLIGIDGMDWPVLESLLPELPTLRRIAGSGFAGELTAVFPPDSIPSWISIFTGLDPSEHGILESIDYFKKDFKQFSVDRSAFKGRTFWDQAGAMGRKVIVVNPLLAYPPWEVNGVMASGPVFISGETMTCPRETSRDFNVPPLGGIVDFPEKKELASFAEKTREETTRIVDFTAALMESRAWDVTFVTLLTLDRIFHFFWRYYDEEDPTHPGPSRHGGVIADFHAFLDGCVSRLVSAAGDDTITMIISDHGHHRRAPYHFNLNQLLLEKGYLESRIKGPKMLSPRFHIERAKNLTLETLHKLDLEDLAYRLARVFPWTRRLKKRDFMTEPAENLATASDFGGSNPFGGVDISKNRCDAEGRDYEEIRTAIMEDLRSEAGPDGERIFLWVKRREEIYSGRFIGKLPDILYEMDPRYGTNWSLHLPLVTTNPRHRKISGGHRKNGTLIVGPLDGWEVVRERISPLNIPVTVLEVIAGDRGDGAAARIPPGSAGRSFLTRGGRENRP